MIGCGAVTELKSAPAYQKTDGFTLDAVFSRDFEKAKDYAKRFGIEKVYESADALINDSEIDAVYIATPPDSHKTYALKVADAGKICCIEKPMAPSFEECVEINEAFEQRNIPLFVSYYRRSLPRFLKVKSWIEDGKIGDIRHVEWHLHKPANGIDLSRGYNWRTDSKIAHGGYFDDVGSHGLDLLGFLLGDIIDAVGMSENVQNLYTAKDAISACWKHPNGVTGSGSWNFGMHKREDSVTIYGSRGKIKFSALDEHPIELENEEENLSMFIENPKNIQFFHVENMREHLKGTIIHPSTGNSAMHTSWVMDKILCKI
ncbi:MAG TPA: Gfo/Idh/MocA family oxidoreductase [Campylobacterales bacterium]|nr:Gfo/Idh/MocA family oxidoreductase [Campylobacterales bacterium]